jgi:transposase
MPCSRIQRRRARITSARFCSNAYRVFFEADVYLTKYSPDLNPIELAFGKLKAHLRKAAEHTIPRLLRRIGRVVTDFSPQECRNFFRHAGYVRT